MKVVKLFSKKEEKEVKLGKSKRGVGRMIADGADYGPLGIVEGAVALGSGRRAAEKAAAEGKSEAEIIDAAGKKSKKTMRAMEAAATGAGLVAAGSLGRKVAKGIKNHKKEIIEFAKDVSENTKELGNKVGKSSAGKEGAQDVRNAVAKIVKNPKKMGAAVAAGLGGAVLIAGGKRIFRRGRLAENAAHKNTIERIKDGKQKEKDFSAKSKLLYVLAPGSYQAKEAAKYGYENEEDYRKDRGKYAALGYFAPGTSTYVKKQVEKMKKEGKSEKEIREYLKNPSTGRIVAGVAEAATGSAGGLGHLAAYGVGLADKVSGNRKSFKKKEKEKEKEYSETLSGLEFAKLFSEKKKDKDKKEKRISLDNAIVDSRRGYGRAIILGGLGGGVGRYVGKREADKADKEGLRDSEIKSRATKKGALVGGAAGAATGLIAGLGSAAAAGGGKAGVARALGTTVGAGAWGALGGALGAEKNTRERLEKRRAIRHAQADEE